MKPAAVHDAQLPARAGIGLKAQHVREILDTGTDLGFFEVHAENYMVAGGPFLAHLGLGPAPLPACDAMAHPRRKTPSSTCAWSAPASKTPGAR